MAERGALRDAIRRAPCTPPMSSRRCPLPSKCDTSGLDANEAFAKRHGFGGTPVIIRADGAVLEGFRPAAQLKAFVAGGAA